MGGGGGGVVGGGDPEAIEGAPVGLLVAGGHLRFAAALGPGPADDLVVHVGDVGDVGHGQAPVLQGPADDVEGQGAAGVAQVGDVVDGGTAHVQPDPSCLPGHQPDLVARQRVVDQHAPEATCATPTRRA